MSGQTQNFESFIERFEVAWQSGRRPDLTAFVPDDLPFRGELLAELIEIDWEYRLKAGDAASAEEYQLRFPDMLATPELLARLSAVKEKLARLPAGSVVSSTSPGLVRGTVLRNYTIVESLGQGGMGQVFTATHRTMKRTVALKVIAPKLGWTDESLRRFRREIETVSRLSHPNIVNAFDADDVDGLHFLVMELVNGIDLSRLVREQGPLSVVAAVNYILQAARGLEHAHAEGVIHRDIKPANLIVDAKGVVKVLDLGLARWQSAGEDEEAETALTQSGQVVGTVDYMSPEQALQTKYADQRSDIYSLGCTLWYLLTGRTVYVGQSVIERLVAHREEPIPDLSRELARTQSQFSDSALVSGLVVLFPRMLAKRPVDRIQSMEEVIKAMEALSPQTASLSTAIPPGSLTLSGGRAEDHGNREAVAVAIATEPPRDVSAATTLNSRQINEDTNIKPATDSTAKPVRRRSVPRLVTISIVVGTLASLGTWLWITRPSTTAETADSERVAAEWILEHGGTAAVRTATGGDTERAAAEWVLENGGSVGVYVDPARQGPEQPVMQIADLPSEPFELVFINLMYARPLTPDGIQRLSQLRNLERITLSAKQGEVELLQRLSPGPKFHSVCLVPPTSEADLDAILEACGRCLPGLKDFTAFYGGRFSGAGFQQLLKLQHLESLFLVNTGLTDARLEVIAGLPELLTLDVSKNPQLTGDGIRTLMRCPRLRELRWDREAGDDRAVAAASLAHLESLCISPLQVSDRSATALQTSPVKRLVIDGGAFLDVKPQPLSRDLADRISRLNQLDDLSFINFSTAVDPQAFTSLTKLPNLSSIAFHACVIEDDHLMPLVELKALRYVTLFETKVTPAGLAKFMAARPDVTIQGDVK